MAEIIVRLLAGDDEERSFFLTREFSSDVTRLNGVVSRTPPAAAPEPGQRGDPITMGAIVIAAASGGALTALVNTIGSYSGHGKLRDELCLERNDHGKLRGNVDPNAVSTGIPSRKPRAEADSYSRLLSFRSDCEHLQSG